MNGRDLAIDVDAGKIAEWEASIEDVGREIFGFMVFNPAPVT